MSAELFWKALTIAALVWYSSVTVYVAVRGVTDIKGMLRRLAERRDDEGDQLQSSKEAKD